MLSAYLLVYQESSSFWCLTHNNLFAQEPDGERGCSSQEQMVPCQFLDCSGAVSHMIWLSGSAAHLMQETSSAMPSLGYHVPGKLAPCDVSGAVSDIPPYVWSHRLSDQCVDWAQFLSWRCIKMEPIIWILLVSSINHLEIRVRDGSYFFIFDWKTVLLYDWRKVIWINWTFLWKPGLIYLPHEGQISSLKAFTSGFK